MTLRQVQIDCGLFQVTVTEKDLNGPQIGAGLQQVGGKAVPPMPPPVLCRVFLCPPFVESLLCFGWRHSWQLWLPSWKDDKEGFHFPQHD
jgi:hypothetical protein